MRDREARAFPTKLFAQGALAICGLVDAAPLQFRHEKVDRVLKAFRRYCIGEIEAVDIGIVRPIPASDRRP